MDWLIERLKEPTTWRGIVLLLTSAGMTVSPEMAAGIVSLGLAVAGFIGVITKEKGQ
jgi:hypothetical protein